MLCAEPITRCFAKLIDLLIAEPITRRFAKPIT
jgi:hypothetical protein